MVTNQPIPSRGGSLTGATTVAWEDIFKGDNVLWRVPRNIRLGDNVVVREDETAVFYRDGKVLAYLEKPGRYGLTSLNAGILGNLIQALTGVRQEAEVYYLQRRIFDGKFGSPEPYVFRDPDFGLVNLRLFGEFRWHVAQPDLFINQFVGTFGAVTTPAVDARLRDQMVLLVYAALGQLKDQGMRVTDLAMRLETIEQAVLGLAPAHFGPLGVGVLQLQGLSVNLPDEVQRAVDTRAGMSVLGVNYMQYQTGQAITTAAANPSGGAGTLAGAGVGLGAGLGMGYGVASTLGGTAGGATPCPRCAALVPAGTRFCPSCGTALVAGGTTAAPQAAPAPSPVAGPVCPQCHSPNAPGARFCNNCGASLTPATRTCPKCQTANAAAAKFCSNCGASLGG